MYLYLLSASIQLCAGKDVKIHTHSSCPQYFGINIVGDERALYGNVAKFLFISGKADIFQG